MHLQGAAWIYSQEHDGKLPSLGFLIKTYGKTENSVGASETSRHDPKYLALFGLMRSHVTEREALFGNILEDALECDTIAFEALGTILGTTLRNLLQDGHSQSEAARIMGIHRNSVGNAIREARKTLLCNSTN